MFWDQQTTEIFLFCFSVSSILLNLRKYWSNLSPDFTFAVYTLKKKFTAMPFWFNKEPFSQKFFKELSLSYLFIRRTFFRHKEPFVKQWFFRCSRFIIESFRPSMASWSTLIFKSIGVSVLCVLVPHSSTCLSLLHPFFFCLSWETCCPVTHRWVQVCQTASSTSMTSALIRPTHTHMSTHTTQHTGHQTESWHPAKLQIFWDPDCSFVAHSELVH